MNSSNQATEDQALAQAREAGAQAGAAGDSPETCPYPHASPEFLAWLTAYVAGYVPHSQLGGSMNRF